MRKWLAVVLGASLLVGAGARADIVDDDDDFSHWIAPRNNAVVALWPKGGDGQAVYGRAKLNCSVGANGYASDCKLEVVEPSDPKFEQAVLAVASLFKAKDKNQGRAPLSFSHLFDTPPDWLKKPTFDQVMAVYPLDAAKQGIQGKVVISCIVGGSGLVRACTVISETPPAKGFGAAALTLSTTFLMKPAKRQGAPVEGKISVPINFMTDGKASSALDGTRTVSSGGNPVTVLREAAWDKTPTLPEILTEIDKKVGDRFADGQVVFQCSVAKKTGRLSKCITANVSPGMVQFQGVAQSLTSKFQANPEALADIKNDDVRVNLAFSFPDMSSAVWGTRYLARTQWIRTPSFDPSEKLFPEAAAKAGLKSGKATVDCIVAANGDLTRCTTVSESAPGMGFGDMAQHIATGFATNPWTDDGVPAEGAHVKMPVAMNAEADQPAPAAAPTSATKP